MIFVVTTTTGTIAAITDIDSLVVTHAEHDADFEPMAEAVEEIRQWNQCHRLELRIENLEDRLWERQHSDSPDDQIIREIEKAIERAEREFEAKNCAVILDG